MYLLSDGLASRMCKEVGPERTDSKESHRNWRRRWKSTGGGSQSSKLLPTGRERAGGGGHEKMHACQKGFLLSGPRRGVMIRRGGDGRGRLWPNYNRTGYATTRRKSTLRLYRFLSSPPLKWIHSFGRSFSSLLVHKKMDVHTGNWGLCFSLRILCGSFTWEHDGRPTGDGVNSHWAIERLLNKRFRGRKSILITLLKKI